MANARKLTQHLVEKVRPEAISKRYSDGAGLYLLVKPDGNKSWVFRYRDKVSGKLRDHGLGSCNDVLLSKARARVATLRSELVHGGNPIEDRKATLRAARAAHAEQVTFGKCVELCIASRQMGWKNGSTSKHANQWRATLDAYCGHWMDLPVSAIDTNMVHEVLLPRWESHNETSRRVQNRIAAVLSWATAKGYRKGVNPAEWKGNLSHLLANPSDVAQKTRRPSLAYPEVPGFMAELAARDSLAAKALQFQILTATRPGEAAGAMWDEIDLPNKTWTIPAARMKAEKEHVVPLSAPALAIIRRLPRETEFVFPGLVAGHVCTDTMLKLAKNVRKGITSHGFRSSFRNWAAERTNSFYEAEASLAHTLDPVVASYLRTNILDKRAKLMSKWATFCVGSAH